MKEGVRTTASVRLRVSVSVRVQVRVGVGGWVQGFGCLGLLG